MSFCCRRKPDALYCYFSVLNTDLKIIEEIGSPHRDELDFERMSKAGCNPEICFE
jgi:hypothetical protein